MSYNSPFPLNTPNKTPRYSCKKNKPRCLRVLALCVGFVDSSSLQRRKGEYG